MDANSINPISDSEFSESSESNANSSDTSDTSSTNSDVSSVAATTAILEPARILKHHIDLPKGLCENANIFYEFFSLDIWSQLPQPIKEHLSTFLPTFSTDTIVNQREQNETITQLFNNQIQRFNTSPLIDFQTNLEEGNYRPDIARLRANIQKSERREQRFQECERISRLAQSLLISREKLLRVAYQAPPGSVLRVDKTNQSIPKLIQSGASLRAKKRYFQEIAAIGEGVGLNEALSDDENYPEGPPAQLSRKQRKHLSGIQSGAISPGAESRILSTMSSRDGTLDHLVGPIGTTTLSEEFYRQMISQHKKRKIDEPDHPELVTANVTLHDVHARTQLSAGHRRPLSQGKLLGSTKKALNQNKLKSDTNALNHQEQQLPQQQQQLSQQQHSVQQPLQNQQIEYPILTNLSLPPPPAAITATVTATIVTATATTAATAATTTTIQQIIQNPALLTNSLRAGTLNQQFQQQLSKSQSLLMMGQNSLHSNSDSDIVEDDDDNDGGDDDDDINDTVAGFSCDAIDGIEIKSERVKSPSNIHRISPSLKQLETKKRPNSVPIPMVIKSAKKITPMDNGSMLNLVNNIDAPVVHIKEENITILHDSKYMSIDAGQQLPSTINLANYTGTVKAATLSDLEGIDMMHLPVDLDDSGNIDILNEIDDDNKAPELMQETHTCFLSLIRDIFCSTSNHRTTIDNLQNKISLWLANPITALNDWYSLSENWLGLLQSAVHFLAGEFLDQPEDFVPYVEYKTNLQIYQWIGAGRDSDQNLSPLCEYWLVRRNEMGTTLASMKNQRNEHCNKLKHNSSGEFDDSGSSIDRPISPPQPRCPTTWTVQKASVEEIEEFRGQERRRFDNPHMSFTYRMHGYESVVGPVKGIYTQIPHLTKARGHSMLSTDRPNFVTILTLVRDSTARLPNGEGTRADICELLKSSQYISSAAADSVLQTIVSGALDRMHTEHDPCVRYDPKKKIWIYLHRNRSEEEFEKMHQQFQGVSKHKKQASRKVKNRNSKSPVIGGKTIPASDDVISSNIVVQPAIVTPKTSPLPILQSKTLTSPPALVTSNIAIVQPQIIAAAPPLSLVSTATLSTSTVTLPICHTVSATVDTPVQSTIASLPLPALSQIQSPSLVQITQPSQPPLLNKIQSKRTSIIKPELVPISQKIDKIEHIDVEASLEAHATPIKQKHLSQQQQLPPKMPSLIVDHKLQKAIGKSKPKFTSVTAMVSTLPNPLQTTTSIKVSTPTGIQTVLVSAASTVTSRPGASLLSSHNTQSILVHQNRSHSPLTMTTAVGTATAKRIIKPPPLVAQSTPTGQSYIIPISLAHVQSQHPNKAITTTATATKLYKAPLPALTSTAVPRMSVLQQNKLVSRTAVAPGKSLLSPSVAAANLTLQQQKLAVTTAQTVQTATTTVQMRIQQQQPKLAVASSKFQATTLTASQQQQQRQMLQTIISQQQQKTKPASTVSLIANTVVVPASQAQSQQQPKTVIVSQHQNSQIVQKVIAVPAQAVALASANATATIAASSVTSSNCVTSATAPPGASLINPQIIQIHQTNQQLQQQQIAKIQTVSTASLTPQQQQNLLQTLKIQQQQQQLQIRSSSAGQIQQLQQQQSSVVATTTQLQPQQSLIIKQPTQVVQQIQKQLQQQQQNAASKTTSVSLLTTSSSHPHVTTSTTPGAVTMANATTNASTVTTQIQPQTLTRIIKPGASLIQSQIVQAGSTSVPIIRSTPANSNPIMAKVLTNSTGQIISLESLLQKQGIAPGTTLRVANAKQGQTSLIQLAGTSGSPFAQYAVVSQGRNLISLGTAQRIVATTQASGTVTANATLTSIQQIGDGKTPTTLSTISQSDIQNVQQSQQQQQQLPTTQRVQSTQLTPRIIQTSQVQSISSQPIVNAKVLGVPDVTGNRIKSGIRMVNASNLNIAHIGGKPVIIAGKPSTATVNNLQQQQQQQQTARSNVIWQSNQTPGGGGTTTSYVINAPAIKVQQQQQQQNNVVTQFDSQSTPTSTQTVLFGNQVVKLQTQNPLNSSQQTQIVSANSVTGTTAASSASGNLAVNNISTSTGLTTARTVVLGATGQPIRVQSPGNIQTATVASVTASSGTVTLAQPQQVVLGQSIKNAVKGTAITAGTGQQRVVLAVQGGGQILLPHGFQAGPINLKSLQGLKVIPIQQQNKGTTDDRQLFAQIISTPQAPRPPNPGGET